MSYRYLEKKHKGIKHKFLRSLHSPWCKYIINKNKGNKMKLLFLVSSALSQLSGNVHLLFIPRLKFEFCPRKQTGEQWHLALYLTFLHIFLCQHNYLHIYIYPWKENYLIPPCTMKRAGRWINDWQIFNVVLCGRFFALQS